MSRPILVATDLNDNADAAIREADAIARGHSAPLYVVHVLPALFGVHPLFPQMNLPEAFSMVGIERRAGQAVRERIMQLTGRAHDDFEVRLLSGSPHDGILGTAEDVGAGLIVLGAHGGGLEGALGNVTRQVVRHARANVVVVRPDMHKRHGPVLVATDFSPFSRLASEEAERAAQRLGRKLVVIYSVDFIPQRYPIPLSDAPLPSPADLAEMQREVGRMLDAEAMRLGAEALLKVGSASRAIAEAAGELGSPLVVVGTHGRTGIGRLALGSVAEKVVERAPCSVLVVRSGSPPA